MAWLIASNHKYRPPSSDTLADRLIPSEAARIRQEMLKVLQSPNVEYVTIGFDGGATMGRDSFTTIHATTADRRAFFLDGECTTGIEHTRKEYADALEPVSQSSIRLFGSVQCPDASCTSSGSGRSGHQRSQVVCQTILATQNWEGSLLLSASRL